ncbi:tRNA-dihydrouridine(16/17) synthase [NAD(P)(+)]-like isoform X2 [Planococcus citri]
MDLWKELGEPKLIVAPMVDASELAWRMLCRKHGAQLCYTPMLHSSVFVKSEKYRNESLQTCPEDRPLIIQFCANNPKTLLQAAKFVEGYCDCIDINLGCPQSIAKRGHYGAFLQDEWPLLAEMVSTLRKNISTPVSCKIRVFPEIEKSVKYAKMLEEAGCQMLTVHGRTREQKGPLTGVASWSHIKAIREAVSIPVIANGNIQCLNDIWRCINETGCRGVMSAEGILYNPALFEGTLVPVWEVALEYLKLTDLHPCPLSYIRGHLFKLFHHIFAVSENEDLRQGIALGKNKDTFLETTLKIKERFETLHQNGASWSNNNVSDDCNVHLPPWICQPWVRMAPELHLEKMLRLSNRAKEERLNGTNEKENVQSSSKRELEGDTEDSEGVSKKKQKKMAKKSSANPNCRRNYISCAICQNPVGLKCEYKFCKLCCKAKCIKEVLDCPGHRIKVATRKALKIETMQTEPIKT